MMRGDKHPECTRCWTEEDVRMTSRRMLENKLWIQGRLELQIKEQDKSLGTIL